MTCPACGATVPEGLAHCPACRQRGTLVDRHERLFLILACTCGLGALALNRLRRSQAFSPTGKVVLGTIAVAQTILALALLVFIAVEWQAIFDAWWAWAKRLHGMR